MKYIQLFTYAMAVAITASLCVSCELEISDNGKLDGNWHLTSIDTLATGGQCDLSQQRIYWAVQGKLLYVRDIAQNPIGYFFRFRQESNHLILSEPYLSGGHEDNEDGGDHQVTDVDILRPFGINNLEEDYIKEQLTSSRMTLQSETLRLNFVKF